MPRLRRTNTEIRSEMQRRLAEGAEVNEACKSCDVPTLRFTFPDNNNGCNWCVDVYPTVVPECLIVMKNIAQGLMLEYHMLD